jgi:inhibitor of KinA
VYPVSSPGGWQLIGRTPVAMFSADRAEMSLLAIGDRVRFVPISQERFEELSRT